jgi:hypothetical protein
MLPTLWAFLRGEPLGRIMSWSEPSRASFLRRRAPYLMY